MAVSKAVTMCLTGNICDVPLHNTYDALALCKVSCFYRKRHNSSEYCTCMYMYFLQYSLRTKTLTVDCLGTCRFNLYCRTALGAYRHVIKSITVYNRDA